MPSWVVSEDVLSVLNVRRATAADLPRVVELLMQESISDEVREDVGPPLPPAYHEALAAIEADANNGIFVAEMGGVIVGAFQRTFIRHLQRGGERVSEIESVIVDEPHRRRGIGAAMMRWAMDEARAAGCKRMQLTSNVARKDAHRFYERLGFVPGYVGMKVTL
jgi:GNAT superfamily N-acetyltransferase